MRGASEVRKATGAKLAVHERDANYLSGNTKMPSPKGAVGVLFSILSPFFKFTPVEPDQRLNENDRIGRLTILDTPGHTSGSISLYDQGWKLIFVGDAIRHMNGKMEGPPKSFTLDMRQAIRSIRRISNFDFEVMLSGHGQPLKSNASQKVKELAASLG